VPINDLVKQFDELAGSSEKVKAVQKIEIDS
jgi:hypothetical protein